MPTVWLSCVSRNITGRSDIEDQSYYDLYEMASGFSRDTVNKAFDFSTLSSSMDRALKKDLSRYQPLHALQGIHMSSKHIVLSRRDGNFDNEKENLDNFLQGVRYVHHNVEMKKVYKMYELDRDAALNKTLLSIVNDIHDLDQAQLQLIHGLNASELSLLNKTTLKDLEDVGVDIDVNNIEVLIKIVVRIGKSYYLTRVHVDGIHLNKHSK